MLMKKSAVRSNAGNEMRIVAQLKSVEFGFQTASSYQAGKVFR